jgi:hypothetical protein
VVAHAFNPSTQEAETGRFLSSRLSLVYKVSSRTARATESNPISKKKKKKKRMLNLSIYQVSYMSIKLQILQVF